MVDFATGLTATIQAAGFILQVIIEMTNPENHSFFGKKDFLRPFLAILLLKGIFTNQFLERDLLA